MISTIILLLDFFLYPLTRHKNQEYSCSIKCFFFLSFFPALESLTRLETDQKAHSSNYTGGEKAGQSWTDKVFETKQTQEVPASLPQDQQEGVDEEEWVRMSRKGWMMRGG